MADKYDTTDSWNSFDSYNFGSYDREHQVEVFGLAPEPTADAVSYDRSRSAWGVRERLALPDFRGLQELAAFCVQELRDKGKAVGMPEWRAVSYDRSRSAWGVRERLALPNVAALAIFSMKEMMGKGKAVGMPSTTNLPDFRGLQELAAFCVQELRDKGKAVGMPEWSVPAALSDLQELGAESDEWLEGCLIDAGDDEDMRAACLA
jgi:hypothetical protein